jgi:UDP-glucose 4-epimerase
MTQQQHSDVSVTYEDSNCVVTGGGGFLGQTIVSELVSKGATVDVIDNFSYGAEPSNVHDSARIIDADIRNSTVFSELPEENYDYIFHFAAPSSVVLFNENRHECIDITINGFMNAVDWSIENDVRLVYPSSGSLYSGAASPHSEESTLNPDEMNSYAKTKRSQELIHISHNDKLDAVGLRIFAGYGPNEAQKKNFASVVTLFAKDTLNGDSPVIFGDGTQERDFIFEEDVAKAALTIGNQASEPIVNVGSGNPISFNDLVKMVNEKAGTDVSPEYTEAPEDYLTKTEAETTLMRKYYSPQYSIEEGVSRIINKHQ